MGGKQNPDAAWYYPDPKDAAKADRGLRRVLEGRDGGGLTPHHVHSERGVEACTPGRPALGPVTLTVPAGRTTVLIGPSGCGKSTLLRLLIGLVEPDAGDGHASTARRSRPATVRAVRLRIGYVIQDGGLFPHLTARGNVDPDGPPPRLGPRRGSTPA